MQFKKLAKKCDPHYFNLCTTLDIISTLKWN